MVRVEWFSESETNPMNATAIDNNTGTEYNLLGDTLEALATQAKALADNGCELGSVRVLRDNGEIVGWVHGDGTWRYA